MTTGQADSGNLGSFFSLGQVDNNELAQYL